MKEKISVMRGDINKRERKRMQEKGLSLVYHFLHTHIQFKFKYNLSNGMI
jgi:hypothetical protein